MQEKECGCEDNILQVAEDDVKMQEEDKKPMTEAKVLAKRTAPYCSK